MGIRVSLARSKTNIWIYKDTYGKFRIANRKIFSDFMILKKLFWPETTGDTIMGIKINQFIFNCSYFQRKNNVNEIV